MPRDNHYYWNLIWEYSNIPEKQEIRELARRLWNSDVAPSFKRDNLPEWQALTIEHIKIAKKCLLRMDEVTLANYGLPYPDMNTVWPLLDRALRKVPSIKSREEINAFERWFAAIHRKIYRDMTGSQIVAQEFPQDAAFYDHDGKPTNIDIGTSHVQRPGDVPPSIRAQPSPALAWVLKNCKFAQVD